VGKETLPANGKGAYHGEFCDGLRHGVGTLMEDCEEEESGGGRWKDCDCWCEEEEEDGDKYCLRDRQGGVSLGNELLSRLDGTEKNGSASTVSNGDTTSSADNDDSNNQSTDDGLAFTAGGTKLSSTAFTQNDACAGELLASPLPSVLFNPCNNAAAADTTTIASMAISSTGNTGDSSCCATTTLFQSPQPKTVPTSTTTQQCNKCHDSRRCRHHHHQQQNQTKKTKVFLWSIVCRSV